ncbi:MAG: hypothetical protein J6C19_14550 [Lachnospiraceae bacterium]|nr:hypothetical protein [Lachnospiraceae bacterium]
MKKITSMIAGLMLGLTIFLSAPPIDAAAAEYTVTETQAVLYTNEYTVILADADENTVVIPAVDADLPIQVTGVTSNGYFRIDLGGQTFYVNGAGLSAPVSDSSIYDSIMAQKAVFPEGMRWTNEDFREWKGGVFIGGYGCAGFAFAVSDAAFGDAPAYVHRDYDNIKVGDILRINNDTHSVIVLEVRENSVIVAEGNYNSSIHWGREIPKSNLEDPYSYILTRY